MGLEFLGGSDIPASGAAASVRQVGREAGSGSVPSGPCGHGLFSTKTPIWTEGSYLFSA